MNYFKLLFLLLAVNLLVTAASAQSNVQSATVIPSLHPDTNIEPAVVITNPGEKSVTPAEAIHYQSMTVTPETKLSIGKASAVPITTGENATPNQKEKKNTNQNEQSAEKQ